ncbi:hypothetical protein Bbelb_441860 [Branchiostoma belcheri]|nr:hypothetical protein Bbelb_441860 [Branchiostoma belcheri]
MKLQLVQRMAMGSIIKTNTYYRTAFWKEKGFSGEALSDIGPVSYCVDDTKPDGSHPAITGFILAGHARDVCEMSPEERAIRKPFGKVTLPVLHAMGKISEDQIWQEEPPSPDVPHTPFEDDPLEKILPSVPQFLYILLALLVLLLSLDAPAGLITLHGGLSLRHSFPLLGVFDKLQTIASKNNYYRLSFFPRTIKEWNELEPSVAEAKSTSQFKAELGRASLH